MFFRRRRERELTYEDRLERIRSAGFNTDARDGAVLATRDGIGAVLHPIADGRARVEKSGLMIGNEVAALVDAGYQKFWLTPSGKKVPALAQNLKTLHAFEEDLREALGFPSLYNESLGTINDLHLYDRVAGRDSAGIRRPWERSGEPGAG